MSHADSDIRNRLLAARLPAMPQILLKLIEQCQTSKVGMAALAELISKDPGMTAKLLSVANSSAYHRGGQKVGLEQSLTALGTNMIKTLVISESVRQVFNRFTHSSTTDLRAFWQHSLESAVLARAIAEHIHYPHLDEAYLAGLLHDVGRLALLATVPNEYASSFLDQDDDNLCQIELREFNITHPEAGSWLIERWNLDSFLADSVLYHHEPVNRMGSAHPLIRIVLLSHLLCSPKKEELAVSEAAALCGIDATDLAQISQGATSQVKQAAAYLGIDLAGFDQPSAPMASEPTVPCHAAIHKQLSDEVRDIVLVDEISRSFSPPQSEMGWLEAVTRCARLLFDFAEVIVLRMNRSGNSLIGVAVDEDRQRLNEFSIAIGSHGRLAEAAQQQQPIFITRDANPLGIAEEQLLRVLGTPSLVCLPLISGSRCLGLMIGGVASWQVPGLQQRERMLRSFGNQAAQVLDATLSVGDEAARRSARVSEDYREASRRVVHEVNNPLSIIKNYLSVLDSKLGNHEPIVAELSILHAEIDRVGQIIKGLTDLKPTSRKGGAEVNRVLQDVVHLFRYTKDVPESVHITAQTQNSPSEIECHSDILKQVLVNLIKNSIEAMPVGGEIQLVNSGLVKREGRLYAELCVRDSGPGISPEMMAKLFSPTLSTKGNGHQGLGLNIVHNLVSEAHGSITCRSGDKGTVFEILLPTRNRAG